MQSHPQSTCVYEPLTNALVLQLLNDARITNIHDRRALLPKLMSLKGPIPPVHAVRDSQYFMSYQDWLDDAYARYYSNLALVRGIIDEIRQDTLDRDKAYTKEMEQTDIQLFVGQYNRFLQHDLEVAELYRNELYNYADADAALMEWTKYGMEFEVI